MKRLLAMTLCLAVAFMFAGAAFAAEQVKDAVKTDAKAATEKPACEKDAKGTCPVKAKCDKATTCPKADKSCTSEAKSCTKATKCCAKEAKTCPTAGKDAAKDAPKAEEKPATK